MGRRTEINGRELLLAAALKRFSEDGIDAVSIRAVNREAGLGPASMHYHFGTKDALVEALLQLHTEHVVDSVVQGAAQLDVDDRVTAADIVTMLARPYLELLKSEPRTGVEWVRFAGQVAQGEPDRITLPISTRSLRKTVAMAFPDVPASRRERAIRTCYVLLVTHLGQLSARANGRLRTSDVEMLMVFLGAGLEAALTAECAVKEASIA